VKNPSGALAGTAGKPALTQFSSADKLPPMSVAVEQAKRSWTEAGLEALPEDGYIHQLVNGELVRSPKNNHQHGDIRVQPLPAPSNPRAEINARLEDYFSSGTPLAWIVHPEEQFVEVCHSPTKRRILGSGAMRDREPLLPGFEFPIADRFKEWDWE
jgi:hypothetical protein